VKTQGLLHPKGDKAEPSVAEAARQQIYSLVQRIGQMEENLRPDAGRERRIWRNLVLYVNADLSTDVTAYANFLSVLYELTPTPEFTEFKLTELGDVGDFFSLSELGGPRKSDLIWLASHYQKPTRYLLLWLCQPKSHPDLRLEALKFLEVNAHGEHWQIDYSEDPTASLGGLDKDNSPFLYFIKQVQFASIITPVCKFIFEYTDDPPKALPVRICKRPGCNRLLIPERIGRKEYCSPKCCSSDHRPAPDENKDYMWLYRLSKIKSDGTLRKRLTGSPGTMKRLRQLETRWKNEPKFRERIEEVRARSRL
jgi:hypothetical protein